MNKKNKTLFEAVGAIHLHSNFSDGFLPIPEIAHIAEEKGLDFLMFSDHNTLEPKRQGLEDWHGHVLVLVGCEINDPNDHNHYLAFRIDEEIELGKEAKYYVEKVKKMGGFGIIAHPAEKRNFSEAYPPYPWTVWDVDGFDGIEIWNQLSEWMEGITRRNFFWRILHPLRSIRFPVPETLDHWDKLNLERRIVGVGGIDVHAHHLRLFGLFPLEIYPYKVQFRSIRTHLLTETPLRKGSDLLPFKQAEKAVFEALSSGCCFVSNTALGDARGFRFWAEKENKCFPMGARIPSDGEVIFHAHAPEIATMRLCYNGKSIETKRSDSLFYKTKIKGVYRIEVLRKRRGWIYSNPIVLY